MRRGRNARNEASRRPTRKGRPSLTDATPLSNEHIRPEEVASLLAREIGELSETVGSAVGVVSLGRLKSGADNTTKFLLRMGRNRPVAVIIFSRHAAPDLVMRCVERARTIHAALGQAAGEPVIRTLRSGYAGGRSYAIYPWYRDIPAGRLRFVWWRRRLTRPVLDWLAQAVRATTDASVDSVSAFTVVLQHLARQTGIDENMRSCIHQALERLERGAWRPMHTIDHNDFWHGNLLLHRDRTQCRRVRHPFVVIDWGGANLLGHGVFDLVRIAKSLRVTPRVLAVELRRHASLLSCEVHDLAGHLFASLGWLHQHLEHFPEEQFVKMSRNCHQTLLRGGVM
jgi:hypothetical protein